MLPIIRLVTTSSAASLRQAVGMAAVRDAILLSLQAAAITAAIATLFGVPLAYLLARGSFRGRGVIQSLVDLPLVVPHTVAGIALLFLLGRTGWVGAPAARRGCRLRVPVGHRGRDAVRERPVRREQRPGRVRGYRSQAGRAARSLGASPWHAFRRVTLPLGLRGVLTGAVLVYARSISEFGAVVIIADYPATAPVEIITCSCSPA